MSERSETEQLASACLDSDGQFRVSPKMAAWVVSKGGFHRGGYRVCRKDNKAQKVSPEQIAEWFCKGTPRCLICGNRCELMTPEEWGRM